MDRKEFFSEGLKELASSLLQNPVGGFIDRKLMGMSNVLDPRGLDRLLENASLPDWVGEEIDRAYKTFPRPPGALPDHAKFKEACTRCNDCLEACPHDVIFTIGDDSGPVINPNYHACLLCDDFPCIAACKEQALLPLPEDTLPKFGQAVLTDINCLNHGDNDDGHDETDDEAKNVPRDGNDKSDENSQTEYCRQCAEVCPVPETVQFNGDMLPVFAEYCTGCGQCVHACPPYPKAIEVKWLR